MIPAAILLIALVSANVLLWIYLSVVLASFGKRLDKLEVKRD